MSRPTLELADIVRQHGEAYRQAHDLPMEHLRPLRAIELCRTAALGGHVEQCGHCPYTHVSYNSCRNRHCPKCQSLDRARWLAQRQAELLPVPYFHVVFTLPQQVADLALQNKKIIYGILFRATAETLQTIARDPQHLGAEIGFFAILHTWGQTLMHHPHLHCVVPGGGISADGQWVNSGPDFFLHVKVLSRLFRRLFLKMLGNAFLKKELQFHGKLQKLNQKEAFAKYLAPIRKAEWVVYAKPPFGGPQNVLEYLGRYTHRVAIANERLVSCDATSVAFRWKDYKHGSRQQVMTLAPDEFLRRFLMHTIPSGFQRIRHYGLFSNRRRKEELEHCRTLIGTPISALLPDVAKDFRDLFQYLTKVDLRVCPRCGIGQMRVTEILSPVLYQVGVNSS